MAHLRGSDGYISVPDTSSAGFGSVDQTGFDLYRILMTATKPVAFTPAHTTDTDNTSGLAASSQVVSDMAGGISQGTVAFEAHFPKTSPSWGHRGFVTAASHYTAHIDSFTVNMGWEVGDTTELEDPPAEYASYEPGDFSWSGQMVGDVSSSVALPAMNIEASANFRMRDEATTDSTLAGTIITNSRSVTVNRLGGLQRITQGFVGDGALTFAGDNKLFDGAVGLPDITELIMKTGTGRTITQAGFLSSLTISVAKRQLTKVSGTIQLTGSPAIV